MIAIKLAVYKALYENVSVSQRLFSKRWRIFSTASAFGLDGCVRERGDFVPQTFECNTRDGIILWKK